MFKLKSLFKSIKSARLLGTIEKGNSKILGSTFSIDPFQCKVGKTLVDIEGSTCSKCYAIQLAKIYPSALLAWQNNVNLFRQHVNNDKTLDWAESMAFQIMHISAYKIRKAKKLEMLKPKGYVKIARRLRLGAKHHRWFTAGDLDSPDMLRAIILVCKLTPKIAHWLPTREKGLMATFFRTLGVLPDNLNVRLSAAMVDHSHKNVRNMTTSTVHKLTSIDIVCPAYENDDNCGDCTMCWSKDVPNISYKQH